MQSNPGDIQWEASGPVASQGMEFLTSRPTSDRLTVCAQSPCPGPVSLNVSFVSGYLGFPPEGTQSFHFSVVVVVCWCEAGGETASVLSEVQHLFSSVRLFFGLMKINLLADLQASQ